MGVRFLVCVSSARFRRRAGPYPGGGAVAHLPPAQTAPPPPCNIITGRMRVYLVFIRGSRPPFAQSVENSRLFGGYIRQFAFLLQPLGLEAGDLRIYLGEAQRVRAPVGVVPPVGGEHVRLF